MTYWYPTATKMWYEETQAAIRRVVASDRFTMGDETAAFEDELAKYHGRRHAICVNSGSSANLVAVAAIRNKNPIMHAAVPALAWGTTYAPLVQTGLQFSLVDCDASWNADLRLMKPVGLCVGCSILGNPARFDQCPPDSNYFLNDNCESLGAEIYEKPMGAFGDIATLSFYHSHQLSAVEGGAILTDNDELAYLCRLFRDHGLTRGFKHEEAFEDEFNFKVFGYNVRPTEINSAIGRVQLSRLNGQRPMRRANWYYFAQASQRLPITLPPVNPGFNPFGIHFTLNDASRRQKLVHHLRANGIDCRMPTGGSFRLNDYGKAWDHQQTPFADKIHRSGMFLGNSPWEICDKIDRAIELMEQVLGTRPVLDY
jgi:CDP-4-dehydro-6-deoxyglucose reductase, E1